MCDFHGNEDSFANDHADGGYDAAYIPTGVNGPNGFCKRCSSGCHGSCKWFWLSFLQRGIVPRNAFNSPWLSSLDLRITQDINILDGHKLLFI